MCSRDLLTIYSFTLDASRMGRNANRPLNGIRLVAGAAVKELEVLVVVV